MRHRAVLLLAVWLLAGCGIVPPTGSPSPSGDADAEEEPTPLPSPEATTGATPSVAPPSFGLLDVGGMAHVISAEPLILHAEPGGGAEVLDTQLSPGMRAGVADGPVVADGDVWYRLRVGEIDGWAAAGSRDGVPWLASIHNGLIAFGQEARGQLQVFVVRSDGSRLLQLTNLAAGDAVLDPNGSPVPSPAPSPGCASLISGLRWSPRGERLALSIGACDPVVISVGLDGAPTRVGVGSAPAWSPDGTRILFAPNAPSGPCLLDCYAAVAPLELHLADASSGEATAMAADSAILAAITPEWSPDGSRIAFAAIDGEFVDPLGAPVTGIYVANADGTNQQRIATGSRPRWSPDGTRLTFADPVGVVAVMEPSADATARALGPGVDAAWSPDGTLIALAATDGAGVATTHVRSLDDGGAIADVIGQLQGWAPDGSELLLTVQRFGGGVELQRYTLRSGAIELLLGTDTQTLTSAAWQPVVIRQ